MVDLIIAALLIAIGAVMLYFLDRDISNPMSLLTIIIGVVFILGGGWVFAVHAGVAFLILKKLIGLCLLGVGLFMAWKFPTISVYQPAGFTGTAILLGLIMIVAGFYLVFLDWTP